MKRGNAKRAFARYVEIDLRLCSKDICQFARAQGMQVITVWKPDMHFYHEIGLWGTTEQMAATEAAWRDAGLTVAPRRPRGTFGVCLDQPRAEWAERHFKDS